MFLTLVWPFIVPVTTNVVGNQLIYCSYSASVAVANKSLNYWYFVAAILTLLDIFVVLMWLNAMYCFVLSLRIKYDGSINRKNCVMRTISIVSFDSIKNIKILPLLDFFCLILTQFGILFVLGLRIKHYDSKN